MKGQLFSLDLMVALSIFLGLIGIIAYFTFLIPEPTSGLQERALLVSDFLVAYRLGNENILECDKVTELSQMSYQNLKDELNLYNDVFVEFKNSSVICNGLSDFGLELTNTAQASTAVRIVHLDGETMQMIVKIYG